ncbi:hypothetical protein ACI798_22085 [Geodermatophilus sp. SYSU D01045]
MRTRTARALTVLLATAALGGTAGTAAAAPPEGRGATTEWKATTGLGEEGGDLRVSATVTGNRDGALTVDLEAHTAGYACRPVESPAASLVPLESATLSGEDVALSCTPDGGGQGLVEVTGTMDVDLVWTGTGDTTRFPQELDHCVGRVLVREATVTGSVTVSIDGGPTATVEVSGYTGDTRLQYQHVACPPPKA